MNAVYMLDTHNLLHRNKYTQRLSTVLLFTLHWDTLWSGMYTTLANGIPKISWSGGKFNRPLNPTTFLPFALLSTPSLPTHPLFLSSISSPFPIFYPLPSPKAKTAQISRVLSQEILHMPLGDWCILATNLWISGFRTHFNLYFFQKCSGASSAGSPPLEYATDTGLQSDLLFTYCIVQNNQTTSFSNSQHRIETRCGTLFINNVGTPTRKIQYCSFLCAFAGSVHKIIINLSSCVYIF